jgi:hypothetical protein
MWENLLPLLEKLGVRNVAPQWVDNLFASSFTDTIGEHIISAKTLIDCSWQVKSPTTFPLTTVLWIAMYKSRIAELEGDMTEARSAIVYFSHEISSILKDISAEHAHEQHQRMLLCR